MKPFGKCCSLFVASAIVVLVGLITSARAQNTFPTSGNVGVGTSSPVTLVNVVGSGSGQTGQIRVDNGAVQTQIASDVTQSFGQVGTTSNHALNIITNNSSRMFFTAGGNVGIGTNSPGARLEIKDGNYADQLRIGHGDGFLYKIGRDTNGLLTFQGTQAAYTGYLFKGITNEIFRTPRLDRNGYDNGSSAPELVLGRGDGSGTLSGGLLRAPDASGTNIAGGNLTFSSGLATGNAASGDIIFQGAPVGSSGTTLQTAVNYFTIKGGGSAAGNVGIGTVNPAAKLHVNGNLILENSNAWSYLKGPNIDGVSLPSDFTSNQGLALGWNITQGGGEYNFVANRGGGGVGGFRFYDYSGGTANALMTIKGSGDIGIGTTTPGYKLDVQGGQVNASGGFCIAGDCKSAWSQVGGSSQWANNGSGINFSTGNVGIGTSNPLQKLAVEGSVAVRPSKAHYFTPTAPLHVFGNSISSRTDSSVQEILVLSQSNDATGGGGYFNKGSHFSIGLSFWEDPGNNLPRTRVDFRTTGRNTDSETASNTVMSLRDDGNVGIGTTSPSAKLDVAGNIRLSNSYLDLQGAAGATGLVRSHPTIAGVEVGSLSNHPLWFITNSAERMRIDGNGTVGINTSTPNSAYKLDVQGGTINSSGGFCISGECKTSWSQVGGGASSAANVSSGQFGQSAGGGNYSFPDNVGIGTTNPASKLDVDDTAQSTYKGRLRFGGSVLTLEETNATLGTHPYIQWIKNGVRGMYLGWGDSTRIDMALENGRNLAITGGKVGIGTNTPGTRLDVLQPNSTAVRGLSGDEGAWTAFQLGRIGAEATVGVAAGSGQFSTDASAGDVVLRTESVNSRLILNSGTGASTLVVLNSNVGIGTSSPQYKLDVAGNINSSATITGNNIVAKYQDVAEWVPSSERLASGTVVVLDSTKSNQVISSTTAYDTRVAGVISAQPGITLGEKSDEKVLVATTGRVRVKVDATNAPINIGDLLVTSDLPGVAMKSIPVEFAGRKMHMPGTIIGKALEPLAKGKGEILVLLSLQ